MRRRRVPGSAGPSGAAAPSELGAARAGEPGYAKKVKILNQPVLTTQSVIPTSAGDEAGSAGSVVSGMTKGPVQFKKGSSVVKVEGQPVVFQTCPTAHNGSNANAPLGVHASPSQTKVTVTM